MGNWWRLLAYTLAIYWRLEGRGGEVADTCGHSRFVSVLDANEKIYSNILNISFSRSLTWRSVAYAGGKPADLAKKQFREYVRQTKVSMGLGLNLQMCSLLAQGYCSLFSRPIKLVSANVWKIHFHV
jgi:hypothetical protein